MSNVMLMALATCDCLRFRHIVMTMAFTTRLRDLTSAHPFLQIGDARADDERHKHDNREDYGPISRGEHVSHKARFPRVRGERGSVNPSVALIL